MSDIVYYNLISCLYCKQMKEELEPGTFDIPIFTEEFLDYNKCKLLSCFGLFHYLDLNIIV